MKSFYCVYEKMIDGSGELVAMFVRKSDATEYAEMKQRQAKGRRKYYVKAAEMRMLS